MDKNVFKDRAVIITGASSGIGRALALALASESARLALAARDASRLEQVAQACIERGGQAIVIPTDVICEEQCRALVDQTVAQYKRLDMVVNNAGMTQVSGLANLPDLRLFEQVIDVNFMGAAYCTYYALPHLMESRGRIVAVSSLGGKIALPGNTSYIASKHAMQGFYNALRMEMGLTRSGVSVTVISPGWVVTEFHERQYNQEGKRFGDSGRAIYTRRMMTADQCAQFIVRAAARRKREVMMWPGTLLVPFKLLAPRLLDKMVIALLKPVIKRSQQSAQGI
jgi:short-subunit dehydrogenase